MFLLQMVATIIILFFAKKLKIITFPDFSQAVIVKVLYCALVISFCQFHYNTCMPAKCPTVSNFVKLILPWLTPDNNLFVGGEEFECVRRLLSYR